MSRRKGVKNINAEGLEQRKDATISSNNSIAGEIIAHLSVMFRGILDSFSIYKTIPLLVNSRAVAWITFQILAANCGLLMGSMFLLDRAISPLLSQIKGTLLSSDASAMTLLYTEEVVTALYICLWLLPITALCYLCSMFWYQDLANATYHYLYGTPKPTSVAKSADHALYATLVWLFMFLQVQLLTVLCPLLCAAAGVAADVFCRGVESMPLVSGGFVSFLRQLLMKSIHCSSMLLQSSGLFVMCFLYGWYGFDYKWIASGVRPDERFSAMERHWAYFVGFGLPYVALLKSCSFFFGFGCFLACFPFSIMLGAVSDYEQPYNAYFKKSKSEPMAVAFFEPAKQLTTRTIAFIDRKMLSIGGAQNGKNLASKGVKRESKT